jgi:hypothetical protein
MSGSTPSTFLAMLGDLLESLVGRSKDSVVGSCSVQDLDQIWKLVNELGEFGGVLGAGNDLVPVRTLTHW